MTTKLIKHVMDILSIFSFIVTLLILASCSGQNELETKELTFKDIENEFRFRKPLSDSSKVYILRKFGSVENYRLYVASLKSQKVTRTISITATKDSDIVDYRFLPLINMQKSKQSVYLIKMAPVAGMLYYPFSPHTFPAISDEYLLDAAESAGFDNLPSSCRAGACATCCSKLISGVVHIPDNTFYDDDQISRNFFPMCVAYATSNVSMLTNQEEFLN